MKKKLVLALLMAALLAGGAFAQVSAGAGITLVPSFGEMKYKGGGSSKTEGFGFAVNAFFDAAYVEVNLGLLFDSTKPDTSGAKSTDTTNLILGVVGKFPISISEKFTFFPFAGIDYNINLAATYDGKEIKDEGSFKKADAFNALSILFGIGFDLGLTDSMYLRTSAGYGIILNTKYEEDNKDYYDSNSKGKIPIKVAVGFKF